MLPGLTVPASLAGMPQASRSCFRLRPFAVFCLLAVGMATQTGLCTGTGMLAGAGMQAVVAHDRVHRLFSAHAWSADQLGLVVARLLVATLLPAARRWTSPPTTACSAAAASRSTARSGPTTPPTARGNRWVIVGIIVVTLPFGCRPACLPVLVRPWAARAPAPRSGWPAPWSGCWRGRSRPGHPPRR